MPIDILKVCFHNIYMIKTVLLVGGIVTIIILAVGVFVWISNGQNQPAAMDQIQTNSQIEVTQPPQISISEPTPTFTPLKVSDTVSSITDANIIVTGKTGDMTLPKDASFLDVFINSPSGRTQVTFDDLKIGQSVSVHIIIPGKKAEIVIEE